MNIKQWGFSRNIQEEKTTIQLLYTVLLFCMVGAFFFNGVVGFSHFLSKLWVAGVVSALTLISIFRLGMLIIKSYEKSSALKIFNISVGLIGCTLCIVSAPFGGNEPDLLSHIGLVASIVAIVLVFIGSHGKISSTNRSDRYASLFSIYGVIMYFFG